MNFTKTSLKFGVKVDDSHSQHRVEALPKYCNIAKDCEQKYFLMFDLVINQHLCLKVEYER